MAVINVEGHDLTAAPNRLLLATLLTNIIRSGLQGAAKPRQAGLFLVRYPLNRWI